MEYYFCLDFCTYIHMVIHIIFILYSLYSYFTIPKRQFISLHFAKSRMKID